jgi:hypothetical protein
MPITGYGKLAKLRGSVSLHSGSFTWTGSSLSRSLMSLGAALGGGPALASERRARRHGRRAGPVRRRALAGGHRGRHRARGDGYSFSSDCTISAAESVTTGREVLLARGVHIGEHDHGFADT